MKGMNEMLGLYRQVFMDCSGIVKVSHAPGRVNLIGEHTDYNDGYVLPMPIDQHVYVAGKRREDSSVNMYAADYGERASLDLDDIRFDSERLWANYPKGIAYIMKKSGYALGGANIIIKGDVPIGAGLSSSAAIETATAKLFTELFDLEITPVELAYIGKAAENDFVGVQCGIMDQFVSSLGRKGQALFIDCRTNVYDHIPLNPDFGVVVVNTMVKRELASSAYNERRSQCEEGVRILSGSLHGVKALRDVSPEDFRIHQMNLSEPIRSRCRHVVTENARVLEAVEALKDSDMERIGELMYRSHQSLRDDYEVSCKELDALVEAASEIPGTLGARMTGAGFGGCTVNIVKKEYLHYFEQAIKDKYRASTGIRAEVYMV